MQIFLFANAGGTAPPPTRPPLLRLSMPANVIVLNHLHTFHDPDTPPLASQACSSSSNHLQIRGGRGLRPPATPPALNAIHASCPRGFIIASSGFILFVVFIVIVHHFSPHPFSSFSIICIIAHYVSPCVIIVHQFS